MAEAAEAVSDLRTDELTKDSLRTAFAAYANTHSAASIRRCWSTWSTLCTFLFTVDLLEANPMPLIGRPKVPKSLPKSYPASAVTDLVAAIDADHGSTRHTDWPERDRAIVFTSLLAGLRADELLNANVGDIRRADDGGVLQVRGKGNKDRRIPSVPNFSQFSTTTCRRAQPDSRRLAAEHPAETHSASSPPPLPCSWELTASASPAEACSTASCAPSRKPASTANDPLGPWFTACGILSPPNSPTPTSASTR